jgi:predicted nucleic acid-binding protein
MATAAMLMQEIETLPEESVAEVLDNEIDQSIIDTIKDKGKLYVPSICLYEVYKKFLSVNDIEKADLAVDIMQNAVVIGLTPRIAVFAAKLGKQYKLPMADSIIYAIAKI